MWSGYGWNAEWTDAAQTRLQVGNGKVHLEVDLAYGEVSFGSAKGWGLHRTRSAYRRLGREVGTRRYTRHTLAGLPGAIEDSFGKGVRLVLLHEAEGLPALEQSLRLYADAAYMLTQSAVLAPEGTRLNYFAALQAEHVQLGGEEDGENGLLALRVPFDNDKWVRYETKSLPGELESYEATALFQPVSRRGIILGSLSHDTWKTGIKVRSEQAGSIEELTIYGGASSEMTRDTQPHGYVAGVRIESPLIFVGFYDDYREGLEAYGQANAVAAPPLAWTGAVPFGWNSWSASADKIDYDLYTATSDFLRNRVQEAGFENKGNLYINFDSFWTNLSPEQMADAVARVKANGHKAGTYWTPFAFWGAPQEFYQPVEGTEGAYTYGDILLRDHMGEPLADIAGGLAIDPTHPGTLKRIDWYTAKFIAGGFEYIKLDFMAHGALEGNHYRPEISTGIAAYHYGMAYLAEKLSPARVGHPFFINLSIAPVFPHAFAHSRRISCDVFGTIGDTEYLLNSLTHGWWLNGSAYRFNDPDHTVLYKSFNQEATGENEGRSRLSASIIAGTVLLLGDDYRQPEAARRAEVWLANREVLALARLGRCFRPVEAGRGKAATDTFVLADGDPIGAFYAAVFNYHPTDAAHKTLDLQRLGLKPAARYRVTELWEGHEAEPVGRLEVALAAAEAKIFRFIELQV